MSGPIAHARATLTIEMRNLGSWGHDCPLEQIFKQASKSAEDRIRNTFKPTDVQIIGDIKITAIMVEDK